mmetsp:Transcript_102030/g.176986  ORF Transcript_102030/g.176986 Transcript_102030/m.176986 type:complete len:241 (+) Transcript_102030:75-797(+)
MSQTLTPDQIRTPRTSPYGSVDFERRHQEDEFKKRELKSQVYETYALLSALITGFCVCTIAVEYKLLDRHGKDNMIRHWALIAHQMLVRFCTALSLFSTLVFMLSAMYSKSALARGEYAVEVYDEFSVDTTFWRNIGQKCVHTSSCLYMLSIAFGFFYTFSLPIAIVGGLATFAFFILLVWAGAAFQAAAKKVFAPNDEVRKHFPNGDSESDSDYDPTAIPTLTRILTTKSTMSTMNNIP